MFARVCVQTKKAKPTVLIDFDRDYDPYTHGDLYESMLHEVNEWCRSEIGPGKFRSTYSEFVFDSESDLILFRLTWDAAPISLQQEPETGWVLRTHKNGRRIRR
jgi:hypothetical protein